MTDPRAHRGFVVGTVPPQRAHCSQRAQRCLPTRAQQPARELRRRARHRHVRTRLDRQGVRGDGGRAQGVCGRLPLLRLDGHPVRDAAHSAGATADDGVGGRLARGAGALARREAGAAQCSVGHGGAADERSQANRSQGESTAAGDPRDRPAEPRAAPGDGRVRGGRLRARVGRVADLRRRDVALARRRTGAPVHHPGARHHVAHTRRARSAARARDGRRVGCDGEPGGGRRCERCKSSGGRGEHGARGRGPMGQADAGQER
mmetsp:Transcript_1278/g.3270  ORF Transcript_1278/g.3270 Transcript_1278/m.3270 type:complete len:262 (-) Transcript_1278:291-1076(-)